jgi:hypothetical protein
VDAHYPPIRNGLRGGGEYTGVVAYLLEGARRVLAHAPRLPVAEFNAFPTLQKSAAGGGVFWRTKSGLTEGPL